MTIDKKHINNMIKACKKVAPSNEVDNAVNQYIGFDLYFKLCNLLIDKYDKQNQSLHRELKKRYEQPIDDNVRNEMQQAVNRFDEFIQNELCQVVYTG
jgi:hypothetical protein